jgi:hypothetical protein
MQATVKAFVTTTSRPSEAYPWALSNFDRVMQAARASTDPIASLANSPRDADVVLFVESNCRFQTDIINSSIYRAHSGKSAVLCFLDCPKPVLPGLYVGANANVKASPAVGGLPYIRVADNSLINDALRAEGTPRWLYSFKGRVENAPTVRGAVVKLRDERAQLFAASSGQSENDANYVQLLRDSKFVLCPRGIGLSSWRLFETMRAGRVPVVISDGWTPPSGIAWDDFAVFVRESDVRAIPELLRALESDWDRRALARIFHQKQ